jgi:hypothetical protein
MDEHGTLSVTVELDRLPGTPDPLQPTRVPADEEQRELRVEGQTWRTDDTLRWVAASVQPGDEITIRVLGAGPHDDPAQRIANEVF